MEPIENPIRANPRTIITRAIKPRLLNSILSKLAGWNALNFPQSFYGPFEAKSMDWFPEFIFKYLNFTGKCFRHCEKATSMKVLSQESSSLVGAYVCPDGFVSQVVYFSLKPNREWFEGMVSDQVGSESLSPRDIRISSRHGWELGAGGREILQSKLGEGGVIREIYWTRYPKTEEQKHQSVSLCIGEGTKAGCMKLFMHDRNSVEKLCPACKAKYGK